MEQDRYQKNQTLFVVGIISLVLSLGLFAFSVYILPNLILGWRYTLPSFIVAWKGRLALDYQINESNAEVFIFLLFFFLTVVFAAVAYYASNKIDNAIYEDELKITREASEEPVKKTLQRRESGRLFLQILLFIVLVFIGMKLLQWLIYTPSPTQISASQQKILGQLSYD